MKGDYRGKVAAVTGAASGIGRALALALAKRGCEVALADVDQQGLAETAALCGGVTVTSQRLDVGDGAGVRAWAEATARAHGRVNFIFNNAGIAYSSTAVAAEEGPFRKLMEVNFWGVVHGTQAFFPHLEASGDGHVVNVSSILGIVAFPGTSAYSAAKFAVRGYTETLRIELELMGSKVTATCVHPGGVKTGIARSGTRHASVTKLGTNLDTAVADFEKILRMDPDEAAAIILRGVQKNARRVLVGADAWALDRVQRWFPSSYHALVARGAKAQLKPR